MKILEVKEINKSFGDFQAVKNLTFTAESGMMLGLLGPNGAGKTTTIRMIMDIIKPDSGTIAIENTNMSDRSASIGYLPEERGLYRKMKVKETMLFLASLRSMSTADAKREIDYWFNRLEMNDWGNKKLEELSKGMQQKVLFVATVMHKPKLLILDEPFMGLDPINANTIKDILIELKKNGSAIIFSTHMMEHAEKLCDHILLINSGQSVLDGTLKSVKKSLGKLNIHLQYEGDDSFLDKSELISKYDNYGQYVELHTLPDVDPQDVLRYLVENVTVQKFEIVEPSLNEVFIESVKKIDKGGN